MRRNICVGVLSFLYSLFLCIGYSFYKTSSFNIIENNPIKSIGTLIICIIINFIIITNLFKLIYGDYNLKFKKILDKTNEKKKILKNIKLLKWFEKNPFKASFIFIILCWIPYIIAYYPAILSPDPSFQIRQYFGIPNKYSDYGILLDENVIITNHHPVLHTLLLGSCLKIGTLLKNDNLGLFFYSLLQIIILSSCLSYTIKFLFELKINKVLPYLALGVYCFVPIFPFYAMSTVKDVIFSSLIMVFIIEIYKLISKSDYNKFQILRMILLCIFIILFRNNGIYTVLITMPFVIISNKLKEEKIKLILMFGIILLFNFTYNNMILPYFKITPGSIREVLSIPFQQTARYVKEYPNDVEDWEKNYIDKILNYDTLAQRYNPEKSDPVKNEFNKYYTKEDLSNYFSVWLSQLKKHPKVYFEATINNYYGYIYPLKTNWYIYYKFDERITNDGFDYHYNSLKELRNLLENYGKNFVKFPIIGLLVNIAFNVWELIFIFVYLIYIKKYKQLIYLIPSFTIVLVCFASPVNTYFRYAMPFVFSSMLNLGIFIRVLKENKSF